MLSKKDELKSLLDDIKRAQASSSVPNSLSSIAERLERQGQEADEILGSLFEDLLVHELQLEDQGILEESLAQRLTSAESAANFIKDKVEALTEKEKNAGPSEPASISQEADRPKEKLTDVEPISEAQIEDLTKTIAELEADLDELDLEFDTPEFQEKVKEALDELRNQGVFDKKSSERKFTQQEEKILDQLEADLVAAERWAEEFESRMAARSRGSVAWTESVSRMRQAIENVCTPIIHLSPGVTPPLTVSSIQGEKALQDAKEKILIAETRLKAAATAKTSQPNSMRTADGNDNSNTSGMSSVAEQVYIEARSQVEEMWRSELEVSRRKTRERIDRQVDEFRTLWAQEDGAEGTVWEHQERDILIEMADLLHETVQWQEAVVEWLKAAK